MILFAAINTLVFSFFMSLILIGEIVTWRLEKPSRRELIEIFLLMMTNILMYILIVDALARNL